MLDFYAHVLLQYDVAELSETIKVATSKDAALLGDSDKVGKMKYKEAQIHGEVDLRRHVERLVAHTRHRGTSEGARIQAMCKQKGFGFSWMDEEQERMRKESIGQLGGAAWQKTFATASRRWWRARGAGRLLQSGVWTSGGSWRYPSRPTLHHLLSWLHHGIWPRPALWTNRRLEGGPGSLQERLWIEGRAWSGLEGPASHHLLQGLCPRNGPRPILSEGSAKGFCIFGLWEAGFRTLQDRLWPEGRSWKELGVEILSTRAVVNAASLEGPVHSTSCAG